MGQIRRKPVSSAFYSSDFPSIIPLDATYTMSASQPRVCNSQASGPDSDQLLGLQRECEEPTPDGDQTCSPDSSNESVHGRMASSPLDSVQAAPRSQAMAINITNIAELPAEDHPPERLFRPTSPRYHVAKTDIVSSRQLWAPFWLRKGTLVAFIVLYMMLLAAVTTLWRICRDQDGFRPPISTNHYTWTYGPTAVLIIVVSLWRQVEYHCKVLAPWHELKQGAEPSRSLLLDYVSPFQFTTLWLACQHATISVIAAIVGFACLKLIVMFIRTATSTWTLNFA
jgi:Protein of unknown function (DUF3433)